MKNLLVFLNNTKNIISVLMGKNNMNYGKRSATIAPDIKY